MNEKIKKTLHEQLELLAERSKNADTKDLPNLTAQMINLVRTIEHEKFSAIRLWEKKD